MDILVCMVSAVNSYSTALEGFSHQLDTTYGSMCLLQSSFSVLACPSGSHQPVEDEQSFIPKAEVNVSL